MDIGDAINTLKSCKKLTKGGSLDARSLLNVEIDQQVVKPVWINRGSGELVADHLQKMMKAHRTADQYRIAELTGNDKS
jgi:hypothetical protein